MPQAAPEDDNNKSGEQLFAWLLSDEPIRFAWEQVRHEYPNCRIRLRIDAEAPQLHTLCWERIHETPPDGTAIYLAATVTTPFSRYLAGTWQPGNPIQRWPIRILVAISSPIDAEELGLAPSYQEEEWANIQAATQGLEVELTLLPAPCTFAALEEALGQGYHVLHFVGHGGYSPADRTAAIVMTNSIGRGVLVNDQEFAEMVRRQSAADDGQQDFRLRLVFLQQSAQTATRDTSDSVPRLCSRTGQGGCASPVIAMQDRIPIETGQHFTHRFYTSLLAYGAVDRACNERALCALDRRTRRRICTCALHAHEERPNLVSGRLTRRRGVDVAGTALQSSRRHLHADPRAGFPRFPARYSPRDSPTLGADVPIPDGRLGHDRPSAGCPVPRRATGRQVSAPGTGRSPPVGIDSALRCGADPGGTAGIARQPDRQGGALSERATRPRSHAVLAELPLEILITTDPSSMLAERFRVAGKHPVVEICRWNRYVERIPSLLEAEPDYAPSVERPLVFQLFGSLNVPESVVLTEDDYFDYLMGVAANKEIIPSIVRSRLANSALLFLGFHMEEWSFRVLFRSIMNREGSWLLTAPGTSPCRSTLRIARFRISTERVSTLESYFGKANVSIFWCSVEDFVSELWRRWEKSRR